MSRLGLKEGSWKGQSAFIVGGGESLKSLDWSLLKNKANVIAINGAVKTVPTASVWFSEDLRVVQLYHKTAEWAAFRGVKILHALKPDFAKQARKLDKSIQFIHRIREDKHWSRSFAEGLSISSNSGVGAINLAQILGADRIYLLGFDCRGQNFHADYERAGFDQMGPGQHQSYISDFTHWVYPKTRNCSIVNLVTDDCMSALECWPRWDRDSFLATGSPSKVVVQFSRTKEVRFDFAEAKGEGCQIPAGAVQGKWVPISEILGGGQEATAPPR